MIEELKLLLPLLREAGQGAFWLVVLVLLKEAFIAMLWPGMLVAVAVVARKAILTLNYHTATALRVHGSAIGGLRGAGYMDDLGYIGYFQGEQLEALVKATPYVPPPHPTFEEVHSRFSRFKAP